jgi:UDP-N-acetylmuramyl tripeptide synthase
VGLLNLTRDQLDRNNEVRTLASSWRSALAGDAAGAVVANADDPLVVWGAGKATNVVWVGAGQPWTEDSGGCPSCGGRIVFTPSGWSCGACDFARPRTDVELDGDLLRWPDASTLRLDLALPGRANRANAAVALCVATVLGADAAVVARSFSSLEQVAGRYASVVVGASKARLLLAKNPAGWMETFEVLASPPAPVVVAVNARLADGRDPSWLWDVPFERLRGHFVAVSGQRAWDLAVRFRYAQVDHTVIADPLDAMRQVATGGDFDVVANYTAFQDIRAKVRSAGESDL